MRFDMAKGNTDPFLFQIISQCRTLDEDEKRLIYQYYDTPYERASIALLHHVQLSKMMFDIFNNTGEREAMVFFTYKKNHQSTKERLPYIQAFYDTIFNEIDKPQTIADVACGLHPFGIPYMDLAPNTQ